MNINDSSSCDEVNELRASANMRTSVRLNQLPEVNKKEHGREGSSLGSLRVL